jgi:hypothetical protein
MINEISQATGVPPEQVGMVLTALSELIRAEAAEGPQNEQAEPQSQEEYEALSPAQQRQMKGM